MGIIRPEGVGCFFVAVYVAEDRVLDITLLSCDDFILILPFSTNIVLKTSLAKGLPPLPHRPELLSHPHQTFPEVLVWMLRDLKLQCLEKHPQVSQLIIIIT
jgi:hypothetical protein